MFKNIKSLQVWILCICSCTAFCLNSPNKQNFIVTGIEDPTFLKQFSQTIKHTIATCKEFGFSRGNIVHIARLKDQCLDFLHSLGYLSSNIEAEYRQKNNEIHIQVSLGLKYTIGNIRIYENGVIISEQEPGFPSGLNGMNAETSILEEYFHNIEKYYCNRGYPHMLIAEKKFNINPEYALADGYVKVITGPKLYFGKIHLLNFDHCSLEFIIKHFSFSEGDLYQEGLLVKAKEKLEATGLFEEIIIELGDELSLDHEVPIYVTLLEEPTKTISLGFSWHSINGPGIVADWSHENVFGNHERIYFNSEYNSYQQSASIILLGTIHQKTNTSISIEANAYKKNIEFERAIGFNILLSGSSPLKKFGPKWEQFFDDFLGKTQLASVPFYFQYKNHFEKPIFVNCWAILQPFSKLLPKSLYFLNTSFGSELCISLTNTYGIDIRVHTEALFGIELEKLPKALRCFGGSKEVLRGYSEKSVSQLNENNIPIGGLSVVGISFSLPIEIRSGLDLIPFFDIGQVYATPLPDFTRNFLYSVGLGICQKNYLGNLQIEIGIPIQPRKGIDNKFELYFFVGERF